VFSIGPQVWMAGPAPGSQRLIANLAAETNACLHLYGKHQARPGRKMGHVNRLSPAGKGR